MASLPRVHVLATGGTIAAWGYAGQRDLRAADLLAAVPEIGDVAAVSIEDPFTVGGSDFTPELLWGLARQIRDLFAADPGLAGLVITQGTDSIEESAFFLDLVLGVERPVVVTGAMRLPADRGADGPKNLLNAVRLAASPATRGLGVLVTLHDEVHAAREVRKSHAIDLAAFISPAGGPIGYLDEGDLYLIRQPLRRVTIETEAVEPRVDLVTAVVGSDGHLVRAAIEAGARGLVVELFGRGNTPDAMKPAIREARRRGVVVVLTSRTGAGRVVVPPALREELGVVSGQDLDGLKARMVLVAALRKTQDPAVLQTYFDRLAGKV